MFKKSGYKTGLFGKQQPLPNGINIENFTEEHFKIFRKRNQEAHKYRKEVGRFPNTHNVFQEFGNYIQTKPPQLLDYDYSFTQARLFFCKI